MIQEFSKSDASVLDERSFRRVLRRATLVLALALGLPFLVLLELVLFLLSSAKWVEHTDQVIFQANRIEKELVTMQTSFRGYRLANDEKFLVIYQTNRDLLGMEWTKLFQLVSDNSDQSGALTQAQAAADEWIRFVENEVGEVRSGRELAGDGSFMQKGAPLFDQITRHLDHFVTEEKAQRFIRSDRMDFISTALLTSLGMLALIGVPALTIWLRGLLKKVTDSYRLSTEKAHQRASELFVTLSSIGDAVVATDARGAVTFLNPVAEKLMGWTSASAKGRPLIEVFEIYNEQTGAVAENPVARVLRENVVVGLANHTILRSRSGAEFPIEDSAAPIRDDSGHVIGVILVFHDVSENREVDQRLQASERRFRFLNELGELTRNLVDPEQIMEASTRMLGGQLRASRCVYADVENDGERFTIQRDYTDGCATTVGTYQLSLFGPRATQDMRTGRTLVIRDVDAGLAPTEGAATFSSIGVKAIICCPLIKEGKLRAMMAVHQTTAREWTDQEIELVQEIVERCWATIERARATQALEIARAQAEVAAMAVADSANRFRLLAEVVSLQVWTANLNGELDYANQECATYFDADVSQDILGHAWAQFVHPDDLAEAQRCWQASLASGRRYEIEFRLRGGKGEYRWFLVRAEAMRDGEGRVVKWFGTNTDIHALKLAQTAAEAASRSKDAFLAALSHELRTPLTPVLMAATTLRRDERLPADAREKLGMMERNIGLEARLIDDLLDLTSIVRGKLQLRPQSCDAHSLIGLAIEIVREDAQAKGVEIQREFTAQRSGLQADPARFQQVIWNLLRNAVKFTPRGGRVILRTLDQPGAELRIEVTDSGIGIQPDALEKVFLPFEQLTSTAEHRFGGLGLGLAIARAIVDLHGGRITASSPGLNQGTTFTVDLPGGTEMASGVGDARGAEANPAPTEPLLPSKGSGKKVRLLLVEDHADTVLVLQQLLSLSGYEVAIAQSVQEALTVAAGQSFDLVISDLGLPDGTGNELMEQLRDRYGLRGVALSGYGMEEDRERSRKAGFVAHIVKPVEFNQLLQALAKLI